MQKGNPSAGSISLYFPDAGTQNVLYDVESKDLTVLNFEKLGTIDSEEELGRLDNIKLELIFGKETAAALKWFYDGRNHGALAVVDALSTSD